ncbi:hypothetical protein JCM19037_469 [Geomicrobium sp. JCM 19037]|nr:hypothetical protein JCM19037_469 [Geomicrobium sp. JCM 19037]
MILAPKNQQAVGASRAEPSSIWLRPRWGQQVARLWALNLRASWNKLRASLTKSALKSFKSANLRAER